jgi:hypothetical protein
MKIRIFSDLHLEHSDWQPPAATADVVVLAGDIDVGTRGLTWARRHFPHMPVVYVPGNHEHYNGHLQRVLAALRREALATGIHLLEKDEVTIEGVRFLGATLWTDFALHGDDPETVLRAMAHADACMNDFHIVSHGPHGRFQPRHAREIHLDVVSWLRERLAQAHPGPTVVVTHHLPHRRSIHPRFAHDRLTAAFASDLDALVRPPVTLWVHGHTHDSMDYVVHGTRVLCNPRGYIPGEPNPVFDPVSVVEVPTA